METFLLSNEDVSVIFLGKSGNVSIFKRRSENSYEKKPYKHQTKGHTNKMGIHQTAPNALLYAVAGTDTHASIQVFPDVRHSLGFQGL